MSAFSKTVEAALRTNLGAMSVKVFNEINAGQKYDFNPGVRAACHKLQLCASGEIRRLIISMPPRCSKSTLASVVFPAFVLINDPSKRIMCLSYGQDVSKHLAGDFRKVVASPWFKQLNGNFQEAKNTEELFQTTMDGFRMATSIGGPVTGFGADYIVIDDPLKAEDGDSRLARDRCNHFFSSSVYSRLNNKRSGVIIVAAQRLHQDDLVGYLLAQGGWEYLKVPAIAEADEAIEVGPGLFYQRRAGELISQSRETDESIAEMRRSLGRARFEAQCQQNPLPDGGNILRTDWVQSVDRVPDRQSGMVVLSVDTAAKASETNDFSVITAWLLAKGKSFLLEVWRRRCEFNDLLRAVVDHTRAFSAEVVLVEDHGTGTPLIQQLRSTHGISATARRPKGDKVTRFMGVMPQFENGEVFFPREAAWLPDLLRELHGFPLVTHDDQVDSVSQYLIWVRERYGSSVFEVYWD